MLTFGERLKELRIKSGYTQDQLGKLVGLTKQAVSKLENNANKYTDITLAKQFSYYLRCDIDYLLLGEKDIENNKEINYDPINNIINVNNVFLYPDFFKTLNELLTVIDKEQRQILLKVIQAFKTKEEYKCT